MLAQNIFVRENLASECLIDDGDFGRPAVIVRREAPPKQQRDFQRRKIVFARHLSHSFVPRGGLGSRMVARWEKSKKSRAL